MTGKVMRSCTELAAGLEGAGLMNCCYPQSAGVGAMVSPHLITHIVQRDVYLLGGFEKGARLLLRALSSRRRETELV